MLIQRIVFIFLLCSTLTFTSRSVADESKSAQSATRTDVSDLLIASLDTVFDKHVDPPTRGELLRRGIKGMFSHADVGAFRPEALGRSISKLEPAEYAAFLRQMMGIARRNGAADEELQAAFLSNLLEMDMRSVRAREVPRYVPEEEYVVQQQIRDNRYVGIGIQLSQSEGRPAMFKVLPNGPANRAGGRDGDVIVTIDGTDTEGMQLSDTIERLRGNDGEAVTLTVRQPKETEARTLELVRGEVPFETVVGRVRESDGWLYDIEPTKKIGYVRIDSIRGSTVGELRDTARRVKSSGFEALVLDLRQALDGDVRYTIMVADELLGEVPLGSFTDTRGIHELKSDAQSLLPDIPLAVLVDHMMPNGACWIAATLQDNERAVLVGVSTPVAEWHVSELTKLADGVGALLLPTASFHRPNPSAGIDRRMTRWTQSIGFNRESIRFNGNQPGGFGERKYSRTEQDLKKLLQQPGMNSRSLLPDHFIAVPRIPGQRITATSYITRDPVVTIAIKVLQEKIEPIDADGAPQTDKDAGGS
ncbi:MAG: PDZ domain-containing protein [Planctomycetes bacterium]|nr:PDZ domain-containing protein [Planctomycetota bacterium]